MQVLTAVRTQLADPDPDPPVIGAFPLASVPELSLPGIETSKQRGVNH